MWSGASDSSDKDLCSIGLADYSKVIVFIVWGTRFETISPIVCVVELNVQIFCSTVGIALPCTGWLNSPKLLSATFRYP